MRSLALEQALATRLDRLASLRLAPVEVAVIDSGIDATHRDLRGRIIQQFSVRDSRKGMVVEPRKKLGNNDQFGHGTAVASVITRLAPNARLIDIRVLGRDNTGTGEMLVAGVRHAVDAHVRVLNMSLAAKATVASPLRDLCETAYRQNQIVVAAKRNMPLVDNGFPAEFSTSISVDREKLRSALQVLFRPDDPIEYAGHGEDVVVAAPGGGYTTKTGTSFATPAISGICALLVGAWPELRPFEVKALLKWFATDSPAPRKRRR